MIDADIQRVRRELERAVCTLLSCRDGLFYAHVLTRMGREVSDRVPTMAVGMQGHGVVLYVNPQFWDQLAPVPHQREGVLIHEVLHVVLRHLERGKGANARLFNIAADLSVNEIVGAHRLPDGAWLIEKMPENLGLTRGGTTEMHYECLRTAEQSGSPIADGPMGSQGHAIGSHEHWSEGAAATPATSIARSAINEIIQAAERDTRAAGGNIPGVVARAVRSAVPRRARTDWRTMLRIFGTTGSVTRLKTTIMSESRRFGTTPGVRVRQSQSLAVVIDTSGSIEEPVINAFFREVHSLWKLGVQVTVIECDCAIPENGVWKYSGVVRPRVEGGGGTDFDPAIEFANGRHFDGMVYLTDGEGGRTVPCRWRLLWMLIKDPADFAPEDRPWRKRETVCRIDLDND